MSLSKLKLWCIYIFIRKQRNVSCAKQGLKKKISGIFAHLTNQGLRFMLLKVRYDRGQSHIIIVPPLELCVLWRKALTL